MNNFVVESWSDFATIAAKFELSGSGSWGYAFRGQPDSTWDLRPSLLRHLPKDVDAQTALSLEQITLNIFKSSAHLHIPSSVFAKTNDDLSWLCLMQHHGAPTRFLDWTGSIYVAAYFAAFGHPNADGAVWCVNEPELQKRMKSEYPDSSWEIHKDDIHKFFFVPDAAEFVAMYMCETKSDRMIAQQGFFSVSRNVLSDYEKIFERTFSEQREGTFCAKIVIPAKHKPDFKKQLQAMNITASSLFPGIDGVGKSVAELLEIQSDKLRLAKAESE